MIDNANPAELRDITGAELVQVVVRSDGKVLWVNVDGRCALRICRIEAPIIIEDNRVVMEDKQPL